MAISLKSLKKKTAAELQPIFTIYGVPKVGKSSLAAEFPRPIFIQTAEGESVPAGIEADTLEVRNYGDLCEAIGALVNEEHQFGTAIFDSTTGLENIIRAEACARNGWKSIEDPGYGKGYKIAAQIFLEYIDGIMTLRRERQMAIVQLGQGAKAGQGRW
ncbi:AAA family ATPase [Bradyrhizobium sp. SZCCHNS2005]|uniref:AAA family ATPase n=1 Tax=Bradyrhizobium sp. SZCCHNS2005 TaxID=3057303 RepID=UPI0028E3A1BC|nr:AAA family ATPase [Bradyrhizobium sp. SZCCHNS2005]